MKKVCLEENRNAFEENILNSRPGIFLRSMKTGKFKFPSMNFLINQRGVSLILIGLVLIVMFSGCAHKEVVDTCLKGHTYGFWGGLWHGLIAPFGFIGSLIYSDVTMYAQNNNGAWYAFGFLIGSGGWGFLGGKGSGKRRKR